MMRILAQILYASLTGATALLLVVAVILETRAFVWPLYVAWTAMVYGDVSLVGWRMAVAMACLSIFLAWCARIGFSLMSWLAKRFDLRWHEKVFGKPL